MASIMTFGAKPTLLVGSHSAIYDLRALSLYLSTFGIVGFMLFGHFFGKPKTSEGCRIFREKNVDMRLLEAKGQSLLFFSE